MSLAIPGVRAALLVPPRTPPTPPAGDPDALAYIAAVEAADGQGLETATRQAINDFVVDCKADGIWNAIKASCILAGARTLSGALVPLVGAAPTNFNFVAGDYDRKAGLVGNGTSKYLNSNRTGNADPQNNHHLAIYVSAPNSNGSSVYIGSEGTNYRNTIYGDVVASIGVSLRQANVGFTGRPTSSTGLIAGARPASNLVNWRVGGISGTASDTAANDTYPSIYIYSRNATGTVSNYSNARLAFYSIGESLDLALLDARVTDLINAFGAAIP